MRTLPWTSLASLVVGSFLIGNTGCVSEDCTTNSDCPDQFECTNLGECRIIVDTFRPPPPPMPLDVGPADTGTTADGGVMVDGGATLDGGVDMDTGTATTADGGGGTMDGGTPEAGVSDTGVVDAGPPPDHSRLPPFAVRRMHGFRPGAMHGVASDGVWAVGASGTILHWDGRRWMVELATSTDFLYDVYAVAKDDVWVASGSSRNLHWDGRIWSLPGKGTITYRAVWAVKDEAWFVGDSGAILQRRNITTVDSRTQGFRRWDAVWGSGPGDVWVLNEDEIIRWDGASFSAAPGGGPSGGTSVWGFGPNNVWVRDPMGAVFRWTGAAWDTLPTPPAVCDGTRLRGTSPLEVWLVQGDVPCVYDGVRMTWTPIGGASIVGGVHDVYPAPGGPTFALAGDGALMQHNGSQFNLQHGALPLSDPEIWVDTSTGAWVSSNRSFYRWDGARWSIAGYSANAAIGDLWSPGGSDLWAVAGNELVRSVGGAWRTDTATAVGFQLEGIWGATSTVVWMPGSSGTMVRYDGSGFSDGASGTTERLRAVHGISTIDSWAVGDNGVILRWDGSQWAFSVSVTNSDLLDVWAASANDAWAVGGDRNAQGVILRWNGTAWTLDPFTTGSRLAAVWGAAADDVYVAETGSSGGIYHWDGSSWMQVHDTLDGATAIGGAGSQFTLVAGGGGLEEYDGSQWVGTIGYDSPEYREIWAAGANDVWVAADTGMHRWDGSRWSIHRPATSAGAHRAVWGANPSDVWAVGDAGAIYRWNGTAWSSVAAPDGRNLLDVEGTDANTVYAGSGDGTDASVIRWDGSMWMSGNPLPAGGQNVFQLTAGGGMMFGRTYDTLLLNDGAWRDAGGPVATQYYGFSVGSVGSFLFAGPQGITTVWARLGGGWAMERNLSCCMDVMVQVGGREIVGVGSVPARMGRERGGLLYFRDFAGRWTPPIISGPTRTHVFGSTRSALWMTSDEGWVFDAP